MITGHFAAWAIMLCLILYALSGGADFGGGVWDLLARGPRAKAQRKVIADAIAPIWEANHVWLIAAVVLLFTCFPKAFAAICVALHVPLTLVLLGIVARGAAFVFRKHGEAFWAPVFSSASILTPVFLGVCVGAVAGGTIPPDPSGISFAEAYVAPWARPFPFAVGLFALVLFAFLAAVYLTLETGEEALKRDFRRRALASGAACGILAWAALLLAPPHLSRALTLKAWSLPFQLLTGSCALAALLALWLRRYKTARVFAVLQVGLVVLGWGLAQAPYLIYPTLTHSGAAAPLSVMGPALGVLAAGAVLVLPAFGWLYFVFKLRR